MTKDNTNYEFYIDAYTPDTMPMARLAEYMTDLALLLGNKESVHFAGVKPGSTRLAFKVEEETIPRVNERLNAVNEGNAPPEAMKASKRINKNLANDNAIGWLSLTQKNGKKILEFLGRDIPKPINYGKISQQGSLEGFLIRLGGKDETIPVWLQEGERIHTGCYIIGQEKVRELKKYLYEPVPIRIHGIGKWYRDDEGLWVLENFKIESFEPLENHTLSDVVDDLRNVEGAGWGKIDDPIKELQKLRDDPNNKVH